MIYSILITLLFILFLHLSKKSLGFSYTYFSITSALRNSILDWKKVSSIQLLSAYFLFMLLPFFWGLTFYLKSDANVVVVILGFTWIYNWTKYIFLNEKSR
ncbi:MAG TPA: hypothetical protein PK079_12300 [Leptospiraceae bacterium]|nr:hypothetical protein [Leptospiraceae bacterium]HMW06578.1 hypothetical protein [Leptospiraceae bacterium]HMX32146.1 hypothetical protein [Leptospiraceae bacterium]HMY31231.1 hypothetical protein [Leptospiraceae bacterium]HMZ63282.1 hypothetical protein [Leptospiraceae bacterium]